MECVYTMKKLVPKTAVTTKKVSTKTTTKPAKQTMIKNIANMGIDEIVAKKGSIDFNAAVEYQVQEYTNKRKEETELLLLSGGDGKTVTLGQTQATKLAAMAEEDPKKFLTILMAYGRDHPVAN